MPDREVPAASIENVYVAVGASADPTGDTIEIGFSDPPAAPSTWTPGTWTGDKQVVTDGSGYQSGWIASFLYGTGALDLAVGQYHVWVRVDGVTIRDTGDTLTVI